MNRSVNLLLIKLKTAYIGNRVSARIRSKTLTKLDFKILDIFVKEGVILSYAPLIDYHDIVLNYNYPLRGLSFVNKIFTAHDLRHLGLNFGIISTPLGVMTLNEAKAKPPHGGIMLILFKYMGNG